MSIEFCCLSSFLCKFILHNLYKITVFIFIKIATKRLPKTKNDFYFIGRTTTKEVFLTIEVQFKKIANVTNNNVLTDFTKGLVKIANTNI